MTRLREADGTAGRTRADRAAWAVVVLGAMLGLVLAFAPGAIGRSHRSPERPGGLEPMLAALQLTPAAGRQVRPRFLLRTVEGRPLGAQDLQGKVVLLSFFATWCPTCKSEMPALRQLAERFRGTPFVLLLVNYGESVEAVRPMAGNLSFAHAVLLDPHTRVGDELGVKYLPTHFLIGRDGDLLASGVGPKPWDGPAASQLVQHLL